MSERNYNLRSQAGPLRLSFCFTVLFVSCLGCQNGPLAGRMQQSQMENERLLSEFRAQKKENEQLKADRAKLLQQQAETEKLAARLQSQLNSSRSSVAGNNSSSFDRTSSRRSNSPMRTSSDRNELSGGSQNGSGSDDSLRSASNSESLQWRPIRKQ